MTLREQIKALVTTIAGNIKAAAGGSTESLNVAVFAEVTHNSDKSETYIDVYKKWENYCVKD